MRILDRSIRYRVEPAAARGARAWRTTAAAITAALAAVVLSSPDAAAQTAYPSAEAAADAFTAAVESRDAEAQKKLLGDDWKKFIPAEDIDDEDRKRYLEAWNKSHAVVTDDEGLTMVEVGEKGWTLPIPIVQTDEGWVFDVAAGADEMKTRRIGRNELATINAVLAYYDAQRDYALRDRNGDGVLEYAQRVISTPGHKDGLYWARLDGEEASPLGPVFGEDQPGRSYHGYFYRILEGQGPAAKRGARNYMLAGRMVGGFALIAWPVTWDDTGVMTFMISHAGVVYESDLGSETDKRARAVDVFNPDDTWTEVEVVDD